MVLAAINFSLLIALMKSNGREHDSISQSSDGNQMLTAAGITENPATDPHQRAELFNDLGRVFATMRFGREILPGKSAPVTQSPDTDDPQNSALLDYSAIGAVIKSNGGKVPSSGIELQQALQKLGDFAQLPIPFSSVALNSGLSHPRIIVTQTPSFIIPSTQKKSGSDAELIGNITANNSNLMGRLFLAANTEVNIGSGKTQVKSVEFISWNSRFMKFDFGVIEGMGEHSVIKFFDGIRCISCHKNKGPILSNNPWSNSTHDRAVQIASSRRFPGSVDGVDILKARGNEVDAGVRMGADLLQNRRIFHTLIQSPRGREAFELLLSAIVEPGKLESIDDRIKNRLDSMILTKFLVDANVLNKTVQPGRLIDFAPDDSPGTRGMGWCGDSALVVAYDARRAEGHHGLSGDFLPSSPRAFQKPIVHQANRPSDLVSAVMLARTIGLTEGDRKFFTATLTAATRAASRLRVEPATIAKQVFNGPQFTDMLRSGDLPDRDDFKDRYIAGLSEALKVNDIGVDFIPKRQQYTVVPKRDPASMMSENEIELVPTTSCLRCHDVSAPGRKAQFSPIPHLAFDPFDKSSRKAWIAKADLQKKEEVLSRMLRRMGQDQDMPPEDSLEYKLFRSKDPSSFEEVRQFLETELRKVRSN